MKSQEGDRDRECEREREGERMNQVDARRSYETFMTLLGQQEVKYTPHPFFPLI